MNVRQSRLGIDFGTSNTVAVLGYPDGRISPLLFDGSPTLPSAVCLDPSSGLVVGRDAEHGARAYPERFEPNPKRRIDEQTVLLGDAELPITHLIGGVLNRVLREAERVAGGSITSVTLTHPAAWGQTRRGLLVAAAQHAGAASVQLVPEPVAAAHTFLATVGGALPVGGSIVVYDLGGGTFDASVVRRTGGGFEVLAVEGLAQAGGLDIDASIVGYLGALYSPRDPQLWARLNRPTTTAERRANRLLWEDVRTAKEILSRTSSTSIHVPLAEHDAPLSRGQFEELARPLVDATITATRAAMGSARLAPHEIYGLFLVGGASRIPMIAAMLQQALGRPPTAVEQPELVVAQGSLLAGGSAAPATAGPAAAGRASVPFGTPTPPAPQPVSGAPMSGVPVSGSPMSGHPLSGVPMSGAPMSGAPMSGAPMSGAPMSGAPMSGAPMSGAPMAAAQMPPAGPYPVGPPRAGPHYAAPTSGPPPSGPPPSGPPSSGPPPGWPPPANGGAPHRGSAPAWVPLAVAGLVIVLVIGFGAVVWWQLRGKNTATVGSSGGSSGSENPAPSVTAESVTWASNALDYARSFNERITYTCPAGGTPAPVWGSEPYTADSSVCTAAVHAGRISMADGGIVIIEMHEGSSKYDGSQQNGVATGSWGDYPSSFSFAG